MTSTEPTLRMRELRFGFSGRSLVLPLSLDLQAGQLLLVTGRNGAGKSTLLRVLGGRHPVLGGQVFVAGVTPKCGAAQARRAGIAWSCQRPRIVGELSVRENLLLGSRSRAGDYFRSLVGCDPLRARADRIDLTLQLLGYPDLADQLGAELSSGQRRLVENARVLLADDAQLLLMDEPLANLQEAAVVPFLDLLVQTLRRQGSAAVVIEHRRLDRVPYDVHLDLDVYAPSTLPS